MTANSETGMNKLLPKMEKFQVSSWQNSAFSLKTQRVPTQEEKDANADYSQIDSNKFLESTGLQEPHKRSSSQSSSGSDELDDSMFCSTCGQTHNPTGSHLYFYLDIPDKDLLCGLCEHPLVDPLDTRCGHTFCAPCLKNHLAVQALCPFDHEIINFLECQQASNIVKRLLEKLPVYCPNSMHTKSCKEILSRCDLETHLGVWCRAVKVSCPNMRLGCEWYGQRDELSNHRSVCEVKGDHNSILPTQSPLNDRDQNNSPIRNVSSPSDHQTLAKLSSLQRPYINSDTLSLSPTNQDRQPSDNIELPQNSVIMKGSVPQKIMQSFTQASSLSKIRQPTTNEPKSLNASEKTDPQRSQIIPGEISAVTIDRKSCHELGISIVGGIDTPLLYIMIQEIYLDSIIARDGRLHPGDQILEINNKDLTKTNHLFARHAFMSCPKNQPVKMLVYRERVVEESISPANRITTLSSIGNNRGEVISITLTKRPDKKLGIKIAGKKNRPGLYVLGLVSDGIAQLDGRIRRDDRILEINGHDLCEGRQDEAVEIITKSQDRITLTLLRSLRPQTPDASRVTNSPTTLFRPQSSSGPGNNIKNIDTARSLTPNSTSSSHDERTRLINAQSNSTVSDQPLLSQETCSINARSGPLRSNSCKCIEKYVQIEKKVTESLGMSVAGGLDSQRGDTPVYVTGLAPNMSVAQSSQVMLGNVLLGVNNENLCGLTHEAAVNILKSCRIQTPDHSSTTTSHVVTLHLYQNCVEDDFFEDAFSENGNFMPSWIFWLHLPRFCQLAKTIVLSRDTSNRSLGFSVVGGNETPVSYSSCSNGSSSGTNQRRSATTGISQPIVIKTIVPNSPAHLDGRLKCGDLILEVNGISLVDVTHSRAVSILKSSGSNGQTSVSLKIVSWPGTIV